MWQVFTDHIIYTKFYSPSCAMWSVIMSQSQTLWLLKRNVHPLQFLIKLCSMILYHATKSNTLAAQMFILFNCAVWSFITPRSQTLWLLKRNGHPLQFLKLCSVILDHTTKSNMLLLKKKRSSSSIPQFVQCNPSSHLQDRHTGCLKEMFILFNFLLIFIVWFTIRCSSL